MPAQALGAQGGEGGDLALRLLDLVLAEVAEPGRERVADGLGGMRLAHRHQRHVLGAAAGARRRPGDAVPDGVDAVGDHFCGFNALMRACAVATFCALVGFRDRYFSRCVTASAALFCPTAMVPRW